jgi:hypothetical protein
MNPTASDSDLVVALLEKWFFWKRMFFQRTHAQLFHDYHFTLHSLQDLCMGIWYMKALGDVFPYGSFSNAPDQFETDMNELYQRILEVQGNELEARGFQFKRRPTS